MRLKAHVISGIFAAMAVAWLASPGEGLAVMGGSVFIDADHYLWYGFRFRDWSLKNALIFFTDRKAGDHYCLCVFHTFEAIALYIAGLWLKGLVFWLCAGCLLHILLDVLQSVLDKGLLRRKWSLTRGIIYWASIRFKKSVAGLR